MTRANKWYIVVCGDTEMNKALESILNIIDFHDKWEIKEYDDELGTVTLDVTDDLKQLRGLIKQEIANEAMRCAAEIEGLPVLTGQERAWRGFAVRVLRGMKIY